MIRKVRPIIVTTAVLACLVPTFFLAGCGGGGEKTAKSPELDTRVVAQVGDRDVTAGYYVSRLKKVTTKDLPQGDDGQPVDTSTPEGRMAFLNVIINKELMVNKALELGYDTQEDVQKAREAVTSYYAADQMKKDLIQSPTEDVTDAEVDEYYAKRQQIRHFQYIICNFRDDALKARQAILDGGLWDDVAEKYNDAPNGPKQDYKMELQYGLAEDSFEKPLFDLEVGQVSEPVESPYGYWIVRLNKIEPTRDRPLDDTYRERIRATIAQKKANILQKKVAAEIRKDHDFKMDDAALWIVYNGLPESEPYINPETNKPYDKATLQPLNIPTSELGRFFYSVVWDKGTEPEIWTIGDYKGFYDKMSVFQRPKKDQLLGSVRQKIIADMIDQRLWLIEAKARGYFDDPRVVREADERVEQHMIGRLHDDVVKIDQRITGDDVDDYYNKHKDDFWTLEERDGHVLSCATEDSAKTALAELKSGKPWKDVFAAYDVTTGAANDGQVTLNEHHAIPEKDQLWALKSPGDLSDPFPSRNSWCIVRLDAIRPKRLQTEKEVNDQIGELIKRQRKDDALQALLAKWKEEFPVKINEKVLDTLPSWQELHPDVPAKQA